MKTYSHLKNMTTHQPEPASLTEFQHYVGPYGGQVQQKIVNKAQDNYAKQHKKKKSAY